MNGHRREWILDQFTHQCEACWEPIVFYRYRPMGQPVPPEPKRRRMCCVCLARAFASKHGGEGRAG